MMPLVAVVGRPNVGKSTLLNTLAGRRIAIVEDIAGVTRDRVAVRIDWKDRAFQFMDTGGIGMVDVADIAGHVREQIDFALSAADLVVFLVDVRDGVTALDRQVAGELRRRGLPVILAANKAETRELELAALEFHELGLGDPLPISAQNRIATTELLDRIVEALPPADVEPDPGEGIKVAIVGRMNAGKSTFLNRLAGEERVIVSEHPGTTRDSVDVRAEVGGRLFTLIDTAGVRRRTTISGTLDYLAQHRTERSVRRADVCVLLLDATIEVGELDKKLADYCFTRGKPVVLFANKWDLIEGASTEEFVKYFQAKLPGLSFAPVVFGSAKNGEQVVEAMELAAELYEQANHRVTTGELNRVFREALEERSPRVSRSKVPKIFYASQVSVAPPTIVAFVNDPRLFNPSYRRFLENRLRATFGFREVPLRLVFRNRRESESEG